MSGGHSPFLGETQGLAGQGVPHAGGFFLWSWRSQLGGAGGLCHVADETNGGIFFVLNEREDVETSDEVIAACLFYFFLLGLNDDLQFNV